MKINSKSSLAIVLSRLKCFEKQKVRAEQYSIDSEIAASILWDALLKGDIREKVIVDLGCGTGILGIGGLILGAKKVFFVDFDKDALELAKDNLKNVQSECILEGEAVFICSDISGFNDEVDVVDVVIMNPPFGVKVRHADRAFLKKAFGVADVVYSLHKSESHRFISLFARDNKFKITNVQEFSFPLKASLRSHRKRIHRFGVSCFRMENSRRQG